MNSSPDPRASSESPVDADTEREQPASPSPSPRASASVVTRTGSSQVTRRPLYGPIVADGIRVLVFLVAVAIGAAVGVLRPPSDLPTVPDGGTTASYIYPMNRRLVSDDFDEHVARNSVNPGTDYPSPIGEPIWAVKAGLVTFTQHTFGGTGGRMVFIDHGDSSRTEYLHLSRIDVAVDQFVQQGQVIGLSGASAKGKERGVGAHLHISLKINGTNVDFEEYVSEVP